MSHAKLAIATLALVSALAPASAAADDKGQPPARAPAPAEDPLAHVLFPPDLIMQHQGELGIDDKQRAAIIKEVEKAQPQIMQVQWKILPAAEQLRKLLEAPKVDEAKALEQADRVMALERQMKRIHLSLLIRIKNVLTDAQRAKLVAIRKRGG